MKGTMESTGTDGSRRGLFRRGKKASDETTTDSVESAVATVDDLVRRMDALTGSGDSVADSPSGADLDTQRAVIARANDLAAAATGTAATTAPEAPVQQTTETDLPTSDADIDARLDAVLAAPTPAPASADVTLDPVEVPLEQPAPAAELAPTVAPAPQPAAFTPAPVRSSDAASSIGIDIQRVVRLIEEEAEGIQHRIDLEMREAHLRAGEILEHAEEEAERIREHGQAQARVLLSEVEEIISEAQQTGEQILLRANDESAQLRKDATAVLQQAQVEARAIIETARREGEQVLAEQRRLATVRAQEAMREQDRLKDQIRRLEERRRQVLESLEPLISQLTQMMPSGGDVLPMKRS